MKHLNYFSKQSIYSKEISEPSENERISPLGSKFKIHSDPDESSKSKFITLFDIKCENLEWISDAFPNVELLKLDVVRQKTTELDSLNGIEKLKNLRALHLGVNFDYESSLKLDFLPDNVHELIFYNSKIDLNNIENNFSYLSLVNCVVENYQKLDKITSTFLFVNKIKDVEGNLIECKSKTEFCDGPGNPLKFEGNSKNFKF